MVPFCTTLVPKDNPDVGLPCFAINVGSIEQGRASNVAFPTLTIQQIQEYSDAYFNTFHGLCALLNHESFMDDIVARLLRQGHGDGDAGSVLALLVFALGQVVIESVVRVFVYKALHFPADDSG